MPGPAVWSSGGSSGPSEPSEPVEEPSEPVDEPSESPSPTTPEPSCSTIFGQCGGNGYNGATCCSTGNCEVINEWYSQCV